MGLQLVIGNKNYSSWSFRPWIGLAAVGIPFDEVLIPFGEAIGNPEFKAKVQQYSPVGKVPVLIDGDVHVWESLAILEYLAETFPEKGLWPGDRKARAHARAISSEMHAGFQALRGHAPMNVRRGGRPRPSTPAVDADVARIEAMWADCRKRFGAGGPFLFGRFTAADAMYAPVVWRFLGYGFAVGDTTRAYMTAMQELPAWQRWTQAALAEPWIVPEDEVD